MLIPYRIDKYEQTLEIRDGKLYKMTCTCTDWEIRHSSNKLGECKHLTKAKSFIDPEFLKLKDEMDENKFTDDEIKQQI